ncbi:hypothetical protein Patl1_30769 [Pistacia atlantica]|uniref:Uncharacterized protein n=1 Tax=Pistacia atlantica TaxID=434234 RepID=A0ACC1A8F3_9ROSI|nr:hypothetical protein Patl1_30769 [Pistacia atlantica]
MGKMLVSDEARQKFSSLRRVFDEVNSALQTKFSQLIELKEAEEKSLKESERFEKEIIEKKISTVTADEYFEKHPELKKKFDDEIRNDYWGY